MSKLVVVSPHLDDAVFSSWHAIGKDTTLLTVFAGKPPEGTLAWWDRLCGATDSRLMIEDRIKENEKAAGKIAGKTLYLEFLDAQYRDSPPDYSQIADEIIKQTKPTDRYLFNLASSPWCHQDHILTRQAGVELLNRGFKVGFYADIPYMNLPGKPYAVYLKDLERKAQKLIGRPVTAVTATLSDSEHKAKLAAVRQYKSQYLVTNLTSFGRLGRYLKRRYEIEIRTDV